MGAKALKNPGLSYLCMAAVGILIALASLAFDAFGFNLMRSDDILSSALWLLLSFADGPFAYALLPLLAGISSQRSRDAIGKSLLGLAFALFTYYALSIVLGLRSQDALRPFLLQAFLWSIAALVLSLVMAPLACKMGDKSFQYRQAAAGVLAGLLGAPYWFVYLSTDSDGLFQLSLLTCALIPVFFLLYRLRYRAILQLVLAVLITSVMCVIGILTIYQLSY